MTSGRKKMLHQRSTLIGHHPLYHLRFRMQRLRGITLIPPLFIGRPKDQSARLCPSYGTGTHHAWFHRDIERTLIQVLTAQGRGSSRDGLHFGMSRHVGQRLSQIMCTGYDTSFAHHHCPHRDFSPLSGLFRLLQGHFHIVGIIHFHDFQLKE